MARIDNGKGEMLMSGQYGEYYNLAQRIEDTYHEIDSKTCVDLRHSDEVYAAMWMGSIKLQNDYPAIEQIIKGIGAVSLTPEEHAALVRYLLLKHDMENVERKQIYFRGHTDNYAYMKKIGAL